MLYHPEVFYVGDATNFKKKLILNTGYSGIWFRYLIEPQVNLDHKITEDDGSRRV